MKTNLLTTLIFGAAILFSSCSSNEKTEDKEKDQMQKLDLKNFDYIGKITFNQQTDEIVNILPQDKTVIGDTEDGFAYEFSHDNIKHTITVLTYGSLFFSDLNIEIDFSENLSAIEKTFAYLSKLLENRFESPSSQAASSTQETLTWLEPILDDARFLYVTLTKHEQLITINLNAADNQDYGGKEGEWVQRGPDGDWVFVPNE
jgi:hypothetical protein